jgi:hypothetical protein
MKILVAGSPTNDADKLCVKHDVGKLYSYLNEQNEIREWNHGQMLMVDSGAHSWNKTSINKAGMASSKKPLPSAKVHYDEYIQFMKVHKDKPLVFVELDVYGKLDKDYLDAKYNETKQIGGMVQVMRVYHEMLDGGSLKVLKEWIDDGQTYIGLGSDAKQHYDKIFKLTKDKIKYHGFALTQINMVERYPFYSVDSTSPIATVIFGLFFEKYLSCIGKDKMIKKRHWKLMMNDGERLEDAIKNVKSTELYLTDLWARRGVIW